MLTIEPVRKGESVELELQGKSEFKIGKVHMTEDFKTFKTISVDVSTECQQDASASFQLSIMRKRLVEEFDAFLKDNGMDD